MDRKLANQIAENLIRGKIIADKLRESSYTDPGRAAMADAYVESLYSMNELLAQARPWKGGGLLELFGKFSFIAGTLYLSEKKGPLAAGGVIVAFSTINSGLRILQRRVG